MDCITFRNTCRWCWSSSLVKILDLGDMPLAWGFLKEHEINSEIKIPLDLYFCKHCNLVQISRIVDPVKLFKNYFYISSVIPQLAKHFVEYASFLKGTYLKTPGSKLLELGSNDGVLLQNFKDDPEMFSLGIDPSENVCALAREKGLQVINDFFNQRSATEIEQHYGKFDVVTGSNMFAHVDDIIEIISGVKKILRPDGVFIFEVHYLLDLIKDFQYDTVYHEHLTYYSVLAVQNIFKLQGMKIIDVIHLEMHWWWIRVVTTFEDSAFLPKPSVEEFISQELQFKLDEVDAFLQFWEKVAEHKHSLMILLRSLKEQGKTIVGYWAPGRWTILLNYCWINTQILDYIVDLSPLRKWMLMPWVHVPVVDPVVARETPPDYFLVLARNYISSILDQEKELHHKWVKFIVPFPKVSVL